MWAVFHLSIGNHTDKTISPAKNKTTNPKPDWLFFINLLLQEQGSQF